MECVSWEDGQAFILRLNTREGHGRHRLPTEAEWEYACRAGGVMAYCFGDYESRLEEFAWFSVNAGRETHPVGRKRANAWGLHDMHGNVWEWVQDWYGEYAAGVAVNPVGPVSGKARVLRGGAWSEMAPNCRSAFRFSQMPHKRADSIGFRLALTQVGP